MSFLLCNQPTRGNPGAIRPEPAAECPVLGNERPVLNSLRAMLLRHAARSGSWLTPQCRPARGVLHGTLFLFIATDGGRRRSSFQKRRFSAPNPPTPAVSSVNATRLGRTDFNQRLFRDNFQIPD